jgi:hypothetical protein
MTMTLSSPVTGAAQANLTTPTYTLVTGTAPDQNGRSYSVSTLGGTQTGVDVNSASRPFTITGWWPKVLRGLQYITGSGRAVQVPKNVYKWVTRKGVTVHADLPAELLVITTEVSVPAGADTLDAANIRAAMSAHLGAVAQNSQEFGNTAVSGTP